MMKLKYESKDWANWPREIQNNQFCPCGQKTFQALSVNLSSELGNYVQNYIKEV